MDMQKDAKVDFQSRAQNPRRGLVAELWGYLNSTKKWWLTPIILWIIIFGILLLIGGSGVAPFIYPLF